MELLFFICPLEIEKYACQLSFSCLSYFPSGMCKIFPFLFPGKQEMELLISTCPLGLHKYACQLPFSCLGYLPSGIDKNNSISCFLANRKCNYSFQHVPWHSTKMHANFHFLVFAIFPVSYTHLTLPTICSV